MKPGTIGEPNLAALIGSGIGSISGLIAVGVAPSVIEHNPRLLLAHPTIGLFCFALGGLFGWFVGGWLGRRLSHPSRQQQGYVLGGVIGGLIPFAAFVLLGWFLWTH
ncbi:MAG: hypothetical protein MUC91_01930 [Verrucomicrobia bacterium]|jgi:hypothetical protein|nr:hypothetical protein [Verrucomicrobiota bacterium]